MIKIKRKKISTEPNEQNKKIFIKGRAVSQMLI